MKIFKLYAVPLFSLSITVQLIFFSGTAFAQWNIADFISGEDRLFPNEPAFPDQKNATASPSIVLEPKFVYE